MNDRILIGSPDFNGDAGNDTGEVWERIKQCGEGGCAVSWVRRVSSTPDPSELFGYSLLAYDVDSPWACLQTPCPTYPCRDEIFVGVPGEKNNDDPQLRTDGAVVLFEDGGRATFIRKPAYLDVPPANPCPPENGAQFGFSVGVTQHEDGGHCKMPDASIIIGAPKATTCYGNGAGVKSGVVYYYWVQDGWECGEPLYWQGSLTPVANEEFGASVAGGLHDNTVSGPNGTIFAGSPGWGPTTADGRGRATYWQRDLGTRHQDLFPAGVICSSFPSGCTANEQGTVFGPPVSTPDPCPDATTGGGRYGEALTAVPVDLGVCDGCAPPSYQNWGCVPDVLAPPYTSKPCQWAVAAPRHHQPPCSGPVSTTPDGHVIAWDK